MIPMVILIRCMVREAFGSQNASPNVCNHSKCFLCRFWIILFVFIWFCHTVVSYISHQVRRGDFQYKLTKVSAEHILKMIQRQFPHNATVFIATDERLKQAYFKPLMDYYDVVFLDDFKSELGSDVNTNFYGMVRLKVRVL
jgi:hypothetical protein